MSSSLRCARLLRRKLEKLESVLYHDKRVFLLSSIPCTSSFLSAPLHPFFLLLLVFPLPCRSSPPFSLPSAPRVAAPRRPLAKLNHFHREYIRHVQNLPDDRERSYVISAHQHIIAYLFFTLTYIALQEYSYPITPIFSPSTTSIPTTVLIIRPSYHSRTETAM